MILLPYEVKTFFLRDVRNLTTTRNVSCYVKSDFALNNFQLCAIRIYYGDYQQNTSATNYNGLRYTNTFHQLIEKGCINTITASPENTGAWSCDEKLPFETYLTMDLCICATDSCNQNLASCQNSANNTINLSASPALMPNLTLTTSCNYTSNGIDACNTHPFINVSVCQDYVKNNSVLCVFSHIGASSVQQPLISENYETYLAEKIYAMQPYLDMLVGSSFGESSINVYLRYTDLAGGPIDECACINLYCNQDFFTCASSTTLPTSTTSTSTTTSSASTTTESTTSTTETSSSTTSTSTSSTATTTTTSSETASTNTVSTTTTTDSTTNTDTTATIATTTAPTSVTTTTSTTTTTRTTVKINESTTVSTKQITIVGESGLGSAAKAGLACGIVLSAFIFTAEIVFFKFYYSRHSAHSSGRDVAYQAGTMIDNLNNL